MDGEGGVNMDDQDKDGWSEINLWCSHSGLQETFDESTVNFLMKLLRDCAPATDMSDEDVYETLRSLMDQDIIKLYLYIEGDSYSTHVDVNPKITAEMTLQGLFADMNTQH